MANLFDSLSSAITKREIRLPDFQRGFSWTEADKQKEFIASVLMAMPLGGILLLEAGDDSEFCCRKFGGKSNETEPFGEKVQLLIDGQQRMTVLMMAFSDIIYDINYSEERDLDDLADTSLSKRFFITIPRRTKEVQVDCPDVFNFGSLEFPDLESDDDGFSYLSGSSHAQVRSIIDSVEMKKAKGIKYKPNETPYSSQEIKKFVNSDDASDCYRIPLFLFGEPTRNRNMTPLRAVFDEICTCRVDEVIDDINEVFEGRNRDDAIAELQSRESFPNIDWNSIDWEDGQNISESDIAQIRSMVEELSHNWADQLKDYLIATLRNPVLTQTKVRNAQKERAIEIFSIINTNATNLTSFDLMVAIAGAAENNAGSDFRNAVIADIKNFSLEETDYYYLSFPETYSQPYSDVRKGYIKSLKVGNFFGAIKQDGNLSKEYQVAFGKVIVFANALVKGLSGQPSINAIIEKKIGGDGFAAVYKDAFVETSYQRLTPNEIAGARQKAVEALNHAGYFFQSRCGARGIGDLNYKLQYPLVACVFYYMDWLLSGEECSSFPESKKIECVKRVFDMMEAWYWISVFDTVWHSNQNSVAREDLAELLVNVKEIFTSEDHGYHFAWTNSRRKTLFAYQKFSEKSFLIREKEYETDKAPEGAIKSAVLQFLLSRGLPDLLHEDRYYYSYSSEKLEIHHLLPINSIYAVEKGEQFDGDSLYGKLSSDGLLRKDNKHRFNSPCNVTYAEKGTNVDIGTTKISEYLSRINAISVAHCIPTGLETSLLSTKDGQLKFLGDRFDRLKTEVTNRINSLCGQMEH